jgi:TetR/AcrR family transcriptional regulator
MPKKQKVSLRDLKNETKKFQAPKTEKERAILMATVELIGERGIDGATTAEIARRAKVTEKTLFRYFPSKTNLVRRVLFPMLMEGGLKRQWGVLEEVLKAHRSGLKSWLVAAMTEELAMVSKTPGFVRVVTREMLNDRNLLETIGKLWLEHVWGPMLAGLAEFRAQGALRDNADPEVVARMVQCLHVGYFLTRSTFAPSIKWDDAKEIEKMADLLAYGAGNRAHGSK